MHKVRTRLTPLEAYKVCNWLEQRSAELKDPKTRPTAADIARRASLDLGFVITKDIVRHRMADLGWESHTVEESAKRGWYAMMDRALQERLSPMFREFADIKNELAAIKGEMK